MKFHLTILMEIRLVFDKILRIIRRGNKQGKKVVVFIHIPKTGGKSFERLLRHNYPDDNKVIRIYRTDGQALGEVFAKVPRQKIGQAELIYGHIPHRIESYIGRECEYFTILRDPVERVLSFYRYVKHDFVHHPLHSLFKSGELTLESFVLSYQLESNKMTKMLAGIDVAEEPEAFMLKKAKKNLNNMRVFGLLEMFDESCLLIANRLGWSNPFYIRSNVTSENGKNEEFSAEIRSIISEANNMDVELYEFARERFKRLLLAEGVGFDQAIVSYKNLLHNESFTNKIHGSSMVIDGHLSNDFEIVASYLHRGQ